MHNNLDPIHNDIMINNTIVNNRVRGYTIDTLNEMEFSNYGFYDDGTQIPPIPCNYKLPPEIEKIRNNISIMSLNIRSMNANWEYFKSNLPQATNVFKVMGFCETKLTGDTEHLYKLDGYNMHTNNVSSNKGGVC